MGKLNIETEGQQITCGPYYVTNLYDVDYLLDENRIVILQGNRAPSVADMEAVAKRFNQHARLAEALSRSRDWLVEPMGGGLLHEQFDGKDSCEPDCLLCAIDAALNPKG